MNTQTGSYIAIGGIIASFALHFGIAFDSAQVGQTISDIAKLVSDFAIIYGIIHQHIVTANIAKVARAVGAIK